MDGQWEHAVVLALVAGDEATLVELFAEAVAALGRHRASREWLEVVSAYDANAITG